MLFVCIMLLFLSLICANAFYFHALSVFISFFLFASCSVLLICLFFLIICSHRCCFCFFIDFLLKGYELSGEIALKNNHYYYYIQSMFVVIRTIIECIKMQNADWSSVYIRFDVCLKMLIYVTKHIYVIMLCIII